MRWAPSSPGLGEARSGLSPSEADVAHRYGLYARIPIAYHDLGDAHRMNGDGLAASQAYDVALHNASQLDLGHTRALVKSKASDVSTHRW